MYIRKLAAACLVAGAAVCGTAGVAAASDDFTAQAWVVVETYPNTPQGEAACWNAKANLPPSTHPDCKVDSETGQWIFLWKWES